jgi:hypothetical protein
MYFHSQSLLFFRLCIGAEPYAIFDGYMGMYNGGAFIRRLYWDDVSGFLEKVHSNTNNL